MPPSTWLQDLGGQTLEAGTAVEFQQREQSGAMLQRLALEIQGEQRPKLFREQQRIVSSGLPKTLNKENTGRAGDVDTKHLLCQPMRPSAGGTLLAS